MNEEEILYIIAKDIQDKIGGEITDITTFNDIQSIHIDLGIREEYGFVYEENITIGIFTIEEDRKISHVYNLDGNMHYNNKTIKVDDIINRDDKSPFYVLMENIIEHYVDYSINKRLSKMVREEKINKIKNILYNEDNKI